MPTGLGGCSLALPATQEGGRPLLLHHGRALTSRQLPPRRGSPVGVAECCTCCGSRRKASWLWVGAVEVVKKLLRNTRQAATQNSQAISPGSLKSRRGSHASGQVPNACLATVETHSAVGPELICKVLVSKAHSVRPGNGDNEGHKQLVGLHLSVHCFQGTVLAEGVESGHQGITLLPPFACCMMCAAPSASCHTYSDRSE